MSSGQNARFRTAIKYLDRVIKIGDVVSGKPGEDMIFSMKINEIDIEHAFVQ
jgi:hypothetical protein